MLRYWEKYVVGFGTRSGKKSAEGLVVWGRALLGSFTDRKWTGSVPHSFNRCLTEKIFSQLEREGRENICFTIHHRGGGENWGGEKKLTVHGPTYCPQRLVQGNPFGWSVTASSSTPHFPWLPGSMSFCGWQEIYPLLCGPGCLMINVRKQRLVSLSNTML